MWRKNAVCVKCGAYKRNPMMRCKGCGFEPSSDYEFSRALILSRQFTSEGTVIGRTPDELKRIATDIRRGHPYLFDNNEQAIAVYAFQHLREAARKKRIKLRIAAAVVGVVALGLLYLLF